MYLRRRMSSWIEAVLGTAEGVGVQGEVDVVEGIVEVKEPVLPDEPGGEGFFQLAGDGAENVGLEAGDEAGVEVSLLHLLGGGVNGLEAERGTGGGGVVGVYLGVDDVEPLVEHGGFAEDEVLLVGRKLGGEVLKTLKPDEFQFAGAVVGNGNGTLLAPLAHEGKAADTGPHLDVGHLEGKLGNGVHAGTVDVAIGNVVEHVLVGLDAQLLREEGSPLLADTGEEFDM